MILERTMRTGTSTWFALLLGVTTLGCLDPNGRDKDRPGDEADADTDTDSDTDSDTDTDTDSDTDTDTAPLDADGDGYSEADGDCDDADDAVHPGATEVCENGKDDDCDGSAGACALTSRSLGEADAVFTGGEYGVFAGLSVTGGGDVNADGYDDVLVGGYGPDRAGVTFLVLGLVSPTSLSLAAADVELTGEMADDYAGGDRAVSVAGDVNGDGYADMFIGAYGNDTRGEMAGASHLIFGSASPTSRSLRDDDAKFFGQGTGDYAGASVSSAGDVNGDGFDDMLVGAPGRDSSTGDAGAAYLILGARGISSRGLEEADARFDGAQGEHAGASLSIIEDFDGDGLADIVIGAPYSSVGGEYSGAVYLVLGSGSPFGFPLSAADAVFTGEAASNFAGKSAASVGDFNGDGFADMAIGSNHRNPQGAAYLVLGSSAPAGMSMDMADARFLGESGDYAGNSVSAAGDVDGDGFDDTLIGASAGGSSRGKVYLVRGSPAPANVSLGDADAEFTGGELNDQAGFSVAGAGDFDADGFGDLLVGAPYVANGTDTYAGSAYLILGTGL